MSERGKEALELAGFEIGEEISEALHNAEGCEAVLYDLLSERLAREADHGQRALALLEAIAGFRALAAGRAKMLTRMCSG